MRLLLLMLLSLNGFAQETSLNHALEISSGYENHGWHANAWNITMNGTKQIQKVPKLNAGFNLAYAISEYNAGGNVADYEPRDVDATSPIWNNYHLPQYARMERLRIGIESNYVLVDKDKHQLSAGLGLVCELLTHYKEYGVNIHTEYDTISYTDTTFKVPYELDQDFNDIKKPFTLYLVPHLNYSYHMNERLSLFLRSSLFVQRYVYHGGFFQANIGVRYHW